MAIQPHRAGGGVVEAGAEAEQGRLAAAGRTDDRAGLAGRQREIDVAQDRQLPPRAAVGFAHPLDFEDRRGVIGSATDESPETVWLGLCLWSGAALSAEAAPSTNPPAPARGRIVVLGDSITAGFGLTDPNDAYPALLQKKIDAAGLPYEVANAGVSGDTTAGGLRRVDWALSRGAAVLIVALGGNDGLRG